MGELGGCEKKIPEIQMECEELKRQVEYCIKGISELESRLQPILSIVPTQAQGEDKPTTGVPLAAELKKENWRLSILGKHIMSIKERIEL